MKYADFESGKAMLFGESLCMFGLLGVKLHDGQARFWQISTSALFTLFDAVALCRRGR